MPIFTAWGSNGHAHLFVPGEDAPRFGDGTLVEAGLEQIWRIEAVDWCKAMERYHELQGWEPYQPLSEYIE